MKEILRQVRFRYVKTSYLLATLSIRLWDSIVWERINTIEP